MKQEHGTIKKGSIQNVRKELLKNIIAIFFNSTKILRNNVEETFQKVEQTEKEGKIGEVSKEMRGPIQCIQQPTNRSSRKRKQGSQQQFYNNNNFQN